MRFGLFEEFEDNFIALLASCCYLLRFFVLSLVLGEIWGIEYNDIELMFDTEILVSFVTLCTEISVSNIMTKSNAINRIPHI